MVFAAVLGTELEVSMPTYEYRCNHCGHDFEKFQRITDEPNATCPLCGSPDTKRLVSLSSFILKGTGWYLTDYARKERGNNKPAKASVQEGKTDSSCSSGACTPTSSEKDF